MDISKIEDPQKLGFNVPISYHALISEDCSNKTAHPLFFPRTQGPKDFVPINPPSFPQADWGLKTVGTLVAADHLGRVLSAAGQLEEAEQHLRRAVDGLEEVL